MNQACTHFESPRGVRALWAGILAGPLLWFANQQANVLLTHWACRNGSLLPLHLVTGASFLGALGALWLARRNWHRSRDARGDAAAEVNERTRFMSLVGLLTSAVFAFVILMHAVPLLLLDPCRR